MTEIPDVADAIAVQSNVAIILSAFAFSALILLFNNLGSGHTRPGGSITLRARSLEGRVAILMLTAFNVGIATAYMFSSSIGGSAVAADAASYRGYTVAQIAFGLQVLALISPVLLLMDRYLRYPGPIACWSVAPIVIVYGAVRIIAELQHAWKLEGSTASTGWALLAAACIPTALGLHFVLRRRWTQSRGKLRPIDAFFLTNSIAYMMMVAVVAITIGGIHYQVTSRGAVLSPVHFVLLAILLGSAAVWTLIHTWPARGGYSPVLAARKDNTWEILIADHPRLTILLNDWIDLEGPSERSRRLRGLVERASSTADRIDRRPAHEGFAPILQGDFGELRVLNNGYVGATVPSISDSSAGDELYELDELLATLRRWARKESRNRRS